MIDNNSSSNNSSNNIKTDIDNLKRIEKEMKLFGATIPPTAATAAEIGEE